ncbi:MAG: hypothetical protein J4F28_05850 [Nitrosopumilaceae archaeon]|nr:hypothetical protein [Nitrosopumilaceae archaeon]
MRRFLSAAAVAAAVVVVISGALYAVPMDAADQFADANTLKKVHFTETLTSSADPGMPDADLVSGQQQQRRRRRKGTLRSSCRPIPAPYTTAP